MDNRKLYDQSQIDIDAQIEMLKRDGLHFEDEQKARHLLGHISLFRMKSYLLPFRRKNSGDFKDGATFSQAYALYKFDSELRKLICSELEKIEVSIRTQMSFTMSEHSGSYWFADVSVFGNAARHSLILDTIKKELERSDDEALSGFYKKYANPFPPSWMTMEVCSFGTLSMLYKLLCGGKAKRRVAHFYGLSDTVMESWLHSLVYVRNICAHHGRLWNRVLRIRPLIPRQTAQPFLAHGTATNRIFYVLSIILYMLKTVNPSNTFVFRLKALLRKYPNADTRAMGFPDGWEREGLWRV